MFFKKRRVQNKMKVFRLSFCFALTLHYLCILLLQKKNLINNEKS